ncbi:MAG: hypothetical protein M9944_05520 [Rhizobiaceae bacterium]|nr:hypothetical protein [Rhizobiaceae bacterium]
MKYFASVGQAGSAFGRVALALALVGAMTGGGNAQGTDSKAAIDAIVGSEVQEEEARAVADADKVIAAIDKTGDAIGFVRKVTKLDTVEIVFLKDSSAAEGGLPANIQAKLDAKQSEVAELRKELEGNAMLFHAIDSRQILMQDVVAIDFDGETSVTIYTTAKPAS